MAGNSSSGNSEYVPISLLPVRREGPHGSTRFEGMTTDSCRSHYTILRHNRAMPILRRLCFLFSAALAYGQPNNSYRTVDGFFKLPAGRAWGSSSAIDIAPDGKSVWIVDRCGANSCADSGLDPVMQFDSTGKLLKAFGAGMFVFPHGMCVDKQGNIYVTDAQGKNGKGHQVIKFSSKGKVLLKLGKPGVAGNALDEFNSPSDVLVSNTTGDIFVADGHGAPGGKMEEHLLTGGVTSNARIMKFDKTGKFLKTWGKLGAGQGEFDQPHSLALDSKGRLFVADRSNNRIQIFNQEGKFLEEWKQFSRPSGIYIDAHDTLYVADSESTEAQGYGYNPGNPRGIRIGHIKDGKVIAFIPEPTHSTAATSGAEGVAADAQGHVFGAEVLSKSVKRYQEK